MSKDGLCCFLNIFCNTENNNMAFLYFIHKSNRYGMTTSCFKEGIDFIQYVIRTVDMCLFILNLFVDNFCCRVKLVFRNSKSTECARIYKDLQSVPSP